MPAKAYNYFNMYTFKLYRHFHLISTLCITVQFKVQKTKQFIVVLFMIIEEFFT